jgi:hypothetical protein
MKSLISDFRANIRNLLMAVYLKSLRSAISEQKLSPLFMQLEEIVPDISDQYSCFKLDSEYLVTKVGGCILFR